MYRGDDFDDLYPGLIRMVVRAFTVMVMVRGGRTVRHFGDLSTAGLAGMPAARLAADQA